MTWPFAIHALPAEYERRSGRTALFVAPHGNGQSIARVVPAGVAHARGQRGDDRVRVAVECAREVRLKHDWCE
jgi:hypothetical protein